MRLRESPVVRQIPNALTLVRLLAVPAFVAVMVVHGGRSGVAAALFVGAAFTDFLDGQIARRAALLSQFGKVVDPLADRLLVSSAAVLLSLYDPRLPVWAFLPVVARDAFVVIGFAVVRRRVLPDVNWLGKTGTALMMAGLGLLLLLPPSDSWPAWAYWAGLVLSLVAYVQYVVRYRWALPFAHTPPRTHVGADALSEEAREPDVYSAAEASVGRDALARGEESRGSAS